MEEVEEEKKKVKRLLLDVKTGCCDVRDKRTRLG